MKNECAASSRTQAGRSSTQRWRRWGATMLALAVGTVLGVPTDDAGEAAAVGTLDTSMVEMLSASNTSNPIDLAQLRQMVAGTSQNTGAGAGVDVAVIDTGVAPVSGLDGDGKVLHGPDLSFEGSSPEVAYLDTYGHGTHMAGIIAGARNDQPGIAPGARIVSVKVAGHDGITTVPQVVAAIDWVVDHRNTDGLNIRVLNLSLGQAGVSSHVGDVLSAAVERAWQAGIVVVIAAGNRGIIQGHLDSPAVDPYAVAVGATEWTQNWNSYLHSVPAWSATGDGQRDPDAVAPGRSIASYQVPGSTVDVLVPGAQFGNGLFVGSGSSQAAAVTSGVAAAMIQRRPNLTPDQVKASLEYWATEIDATSQIKDGDGVLRAMHSVYYGAPANVPAQNHPTAAGQGTGLAAPTGATWSGGGWTGATWSGATWSGTVWSGATWSGATWSGATWSGATWSGATWSGATWSGATWSGATWSGATWSGNGWS